MKLPRSFLRIVKKAFQAFLKIPQGFFFYAAQYFYLFFFTVFVWTEPLLPFENKCVW